MDPNNNVFDSSNVFLFVIRWWKHLFIICLVAAIAAAIFSAPFFITPKFQSSVIMFPTTSGSLSRTVLVGAEWARQDFLDYGEVEEAERTLQVLESGNVRDRIIERFDLMSHYEIPADAQYPRSQITEEYNSNISFRRTQYGAVEISVRDKDPAMAAEIANELAALGDTVQNELRRERAELAYEVAKGQYENLQAQVREVEDSLRNIMELGVYDMEGQSAMLTRQLAKDLSADNQEGVARLEERLRLLSEHGGSFVLHTAYLDDISDHLISSQRRYQEARADLENFVPFKFVLDRAYESERKVYPVRWLIVFLSVFAAGFAGVMILMVYENLRNKGIIKEKKAKTPKSS